MNIMMLEAYRDAGHLKTLNQFAATASWSDYHVHTFNEGERTGSIQFADNNMNNPSYPIIRNFSAAFVSAVVLNACATTPDSTAQSDFLLNPASSSASVTEIPSTGAVRSLNRKDSNGWVNSIDDTGPDAAKVVVNKANPNKRFVLRPLGADVSGDSVAATLVGNDYIKIIGSYFPKVVYQSPRLNAKLLMRVAPGSKFPLEKLDDGWYQISTDQGSGYLRLQDGQPTDSKG